jgi:hypothetical protein
VLIHCCDAQKEISQKMAREVEAICGLFFIVALFALVGGFMASLTKPITMPVIKAVATVVTSKPIVTAATTGLMTALYTCVGLFGLFMLMMICG